MVGTGHFGEWDAAAVGGEASGVLGSEVEEQAGRGDFCLGERVLGDAGSLVFDLDGEVVGSQEWLAGFLDAGQFGGLQAVIEVLGHPDLQQAGGAGADGAAAVDEILAHPAHLGDVEVGWHQVAIGKQKMQGSFRVLGKGVAQVGQFQRHCHSFDQARNSRGTTTSPATRSHHLPSIPTTTQADNQVRLCRKGCRG